jgi:hypothetical protein
MKLNTLLEAKYDTGHYGRPEFKGLSAKEVLTKFYEKEDDTSWVLKQGLRATYYGSDPYSPGQLDCEYLFGSFTKSGEPDFFAYQDEGEHEIDPAGIEVVATILIHEP